MDLNRETAMRLWSKSFGKDTKAVDFAGRTIAKGAYNDRNSEFGWNVDHILPQSKGGATADHNLICCHIKTNDEKADKFPCFTANEGVFEIVKVQNHYEIKAKGEDKSNESLNYYDSASGVRFFKSLKKIQGKE
ncbi:MAG: HNH endonuclease, partial [Clostridia bacterium]|nr:HNH endonuclease [Clostridia bacterium]